MTPLYLRNDDYIIAQDAAQAAPAPRSRNGTAARVRLPGARGRRSGRRPQVLDVADLLCGRRAPALCAGAIGAILGRVNGRQVALVLAGLAVFIAGVLVGLTPVRAPLPENGPAASAPFLEPVDALQHGPEQVLLTLMLIALGLLTAIGGAYLWRDRR
jgi:hypothetical protein